VQGRRSAPPLEDILARAESAVAESRASEPAISESDPIVIDKTTDRRTQRRTLLRLPAWFIAYRQGLHKHVAMVRDMTEDGIFLYSDRDFRPTCGQEIEFVINFPKWTKTGPVACKGKVVRVEESATGGAVGVAVQLSRHWVLG